MEHIDQYRLANGMWLVAEPVPGAQSLAMSWLLPAGASTEPASQQGVAALLAEMICRGAGELDARAHSDALDRLGVQRSTGVESVHLRVAAIMIASKLPDALPLLTDMVRRPMLAPATLDPSRDLALQSLESLEDEPQHKVFIELRQRHYPAPFGRSPLGRKEYLETATTDQVRAYWQRAFVPSASVIGFAGKYEWPALRDQVEQLLGNWTGTTTEPAAQAPPVRGYHHESAESTQVHIGLAFDALPEPHPQSILQKAAVSVLSGGMSSRLFTEVREKRGLCYAVGARYSGDKIHGAVLAYSGTTAPRAQETLDVLAAELRRISQGIAADEFQRAIIGMKASLVMQGESTGARAASIAADQYVYGRPRTLDELAALVDSLRLEALGDFVRDHPPGPMTLVTVGPHELNFGG